MPFDFSNPEPFMTQTQTQIGSHADATAEYQRQSEKLSLEPGKSKKGNNDGGVAVEAKFITPLDPVIQTADGNRLPAVPVDEAHKINILKDVTDGKPVSSRRELARPRGFSRFEGQYGSSKQSLEAQNDDDSSTRLGTAIPPAHTHPLFPPLPLYGPPSLLRDLQCISFRITSFFLSNAFLMVIVLGSVFTFFPLMFKYIWLWLTFRDPNTRRPFHQEELFRQQRRKEINAQWIKKQRKRSSEDSANGELNGTAAEEYFPLEGGPDKLVCDLRYYARRVGLEAEEYKVQTEDGFILGLWHIYNPSEYKPASKETRKHSTPEVFPSKPHKQHRTIYNQYTDGNRRYPVLLMHGLLQSAGAYCSNDEDSLAFYLCKAGYDVWLGQNRCGFEPEHSLLQYHDPRMWAWNIRQMGVMDLPAFMSRVLEETGFEKLGLVCHSQGTTETFVALAREQRPDLGEKISVFCALAPAVYAGPLIGKMYFKFMRIISPAMFRMFFGIHSFIPLMMIMHKSLPGKLYGVVGYRVFSFLFNWTDDRWDRGLRDRQFQFAPVYVSAESMRWWLGRECFAKHKCILATWDAGQQEEVEDEEEEERREEAMSNRSDRGKTAWYDKSAPPMAFWVAGRDELVDGRRLIRRFERGREPHVKLVHAKVIDEYEHLDVLWAMDAIEQVGKEVKQVLWNTMPDDAKRICRRVNDLDDDLLSDDNHGSDLTFATTE